MFLFKRCENGSGDLWLTVGAVGIEVQELAKAHNRRLASPNARVSKTALIDHAKLGTD